MKIIIILILSLSSLFALQKTDFAYQKVIHLKQNTGILKLALDSDIYTKLVHSDLSDMLVFDTNNQAMPHHILSEQAKAVELERKIVPFTKFTLLKKDTQEKLHFEYEGAVVKMHSNSAAKSEDYIVDLRDINKEVQTLYIQSPLKKYMLNMDVQCSNDLQVWKTLKSKAVLARLDFQNTKIQNTSISLPFIKCNYLRLRTKKEFLISKIEVRAYAKEGALRIEKEGIIFNKTKEFLDFSLSKNIRLDTLYFELEDKQQYYQVSVFAKNKNDKEYKQIKNADLYTIVSENKKIQKHSIFLSTNYDLYQIHAQKSSYLPTKLSLSYSYKKQDLYFLAQGQDPYILAFGSYYSRAKPTNIVDLIHNTQDIKEVKMGSIQDLAGEAKLHAKKEEVNFKQYFVWLFLVFGVGLLGFISYRLFKQV